MASKYLIHISSYHFHALLSLVILCLIHLYANHMRFLGWIWHKRFLSFAGGISFAYVFISLLPELAQGQEALEKALRGFLPFLERHVYLVALFGFLFYYSIQNSPSSNKTAPWKNVHFWISMSGYVIFNLLIGSAIADSDNPDVQPLYLFTLAMGLHYFVNDHNLREKHKEQYEKKGRWILIIALIGGWILGLTIAISDALIAFLVSFAAGGVLLNVMCYELPKKSEEGTIYFSSGAILYAATLITIGKNHV